MLRRRRIAAVAAVIATAMVASIGSGRGLRPRSGRSSSSSDGTLAAREQTAVLANVGRGGHARPHPRARIEDRARRRGRQGRAVAALEVSSARRVRRGRQDPHRDRGAERSRCSPSSTRSTMIDAPEGWDLAGLGAFPATGRDARSGSSTPGSTARTPSSPAGVSNCGQSTAFFGVGGAVRDGCTDEDGHGTKVPASSARRRTTASASPASRSTRPLAVCRALEDGLGRGSTSNVVNCLSWLRSKGAKVISMSFGGASSTTLQNAVKSAWNNG